jgi:hypothetical protein
MIDVCKLKFEMSTCEVRLFVPKGCFTAYVSELTVVDEIFWPQLYVLMGDSNKFQILICKRQS